MNPWIKKYAPVSLKDVVGHEREISFIREYVSSEKKSYKPLFIYGGTGNGKTSMVYALAQDLDYELTEINASDTRNADAINSLLSGVLMQGSLFGNKKVILVDEVEGISGVKDRGALQALQKFFPSKYPLILIGDDAYSEKLKKLAKVCETIEFKPLTVEQISSLLKNICVKENVSFEPEALTQLARISGGDARAAINDLQSISLNKNLTLKSLDSISDRDLTSNMQDALTRVFKSSSVESALGAFDQVPEDLDKIFLWVEENIPSEYLQPEALAKAYLNLSLADVFYGRIRRWQYYRFYVYCYALLSVGIALSKVQKNKATTKYKPSSRLLSIWIYNNANAKKKNIAKKVSEKTHGSARTAYHSVIPFLRVMANNHGFEATARFFDLNQEEIEWLQKK